ncbi:hypothetical protein ACE4Z5_26865, partial [Salmonella enterica]|uniref:hypothetical protein n=1 Tax=Salmonella enterica TaxID=28901 RepID=UPI003D2E4A21
NLPHEITFKLKESNEKRYLTQKLRGFKGDEIVNTLWISKFSRSSLFFLPFHVPDGPYIFLIANQKNITFQVKKKVFKTICLPRINV